MSVIDKTIDDLKEALNKINDVSIIVMEQQDFEKLLAYLYGLLNNYKNQRTSPANSMEVLGLAHQMLDRIIKHYIKFNIAASQNTIYIYNQSIELLLSIVYFDFNINEYSYGQAVEKKMFLRALKASDINPPGHSNLIGVGRWHDSKSEEALDAQALNFAAENIKIYSNFVFYLAQDGNYIQDPFRTHPICSHLEIYSKLKSLTTSYNLLPMQSV